MLYKAPEACLASVSMDSSQFCAIVTDNQQRQYSLTLCDHHLFYVLQREVWELNTDGSSFVALTIKEFARCVNAAEHNRELVEKNARQRCGESKSIQSCPVPPPTVLGATDIQTSTTDSHGTKLTPFSSLSSCHHPATEASEPPPLTLSEELLSSFREDSSLFFSLSKELYEISRDQSGGCRVEPQTLQAHCPGFKMCVGLFRQVYNTQVRRVVTALPAHLNGLTRDHLLAFRGAVLAAFHLSPEGGAGVGTDASNSETAWTYQHILCDAYFFPPQGTPGERPPPFVDVTLSHVPPLRRQQPVEPNENDTQTFGLTQLLANPTWEPEGRATRCPGCARAFRSVAYPFGVSAHHCRGCGRRLCGFCILKKAHRSFAKLNKPGPSYGKVPEVRLVCNPCYEQYMALEQVRYLGSLFALAGLDFVNISLCRTVNQQWRNAAELCISEYRLLLHTCKPDLRSVLSPIGVLLQNSVDFILSHEADSTPASSISSIVVNEQPTASQTIGVHREAALLLLSFIKQENLWELPSSRAFISRLALVSPAIAMQRPTFSHWHFYCTAFCRSMDSFYFYIKSLETLCDAPTSYAYVLEVKQKLCGHVLQELWQSTSAESQSCAPSRHPAPANVQAAVVYLLDMLSRDAAATLPRQQIYQGVLEALLPAFAVSSLQLAFVVLCALQSTMRSAQPTCDVELLGAWRTRILEELSSEGLEEYRSMTEATLDFFSTMDAFCSQSSSPVNSMELVRWIRSYCGETSPSYPASARSQTREIKGSGGLESTEESSTASSSSAYADLPFPILNPFKPWVELRSVLLTSIRVESLSSSKPVWITFSVYNNAQRSSRRNARKRNSADKADEEEKFYSFLYKRESAMRDQLMCISSRLLQWLLRDQIGDRVQIGNYSVLPLSDRSALIENLEGYILYKLPGVSNGNLALVTYLTQRGEAAQTNFLTSAKLFLLLNYIFSIGDRHQGNVMMSPVGAILHIDFSYIFSEKTLVEKIAGTTMRVDSQLLSAVAFCRRAAAAATTSRSSLFGHNFSPLPPCESLLDASRAPNEISHRDSSSCSNNSSLATDNDSFFKEAAEWFLQVRPHAALFYEVWRYAVRCHSLPFDESNLATIFNTLFDRSVSRKSSADSFLRIMEHSINVCRLKDVTHSSVQAFRSYTDHVARCVSETPSGAKRLLEFMRSRLNLPGL